MAAFNENAETDVEKSLIWRSHVLCWAGKRGLGLDGDFVECGTYKGTSARIMVDYLHMGMTDKKFYLYDLFEHSDDMVHHKLDQHGADLYARVCEHFADQDGVKIVKGSVHDTLPKTSPDRIAFLHIDMNNAPAERAALDHLFDKVTPRRLHRVRRLWLAGVSRPEGHGG